MEFNVYTVMIGSLVIALIISYIKCFFKKRKLNYIIEEKKKEIDKWKISTVDHHDLIGESVSGYKKQLEQFKEEKHQLQLKIFELEKDKEYKEILWKSLTPQIAKTNPEIVESYNQLILQSKEDEKTIVGKFLK